MFRRTIQVITIISFAASCAAEPSQLTANSKGPCLGEKCLPPEEPPADATSDESAFSVAAEECLSCLGVTSTACLDEFEDCSMSLACRSWRDCNSSCVVNDDESVCYEVCDSTAEDFFTPEKLKSCSCEVCYAQCFNMCPP